MVIIALQCNDAGIKE